MAENNGSPGMNRLARVISGRAAQVAGKAPRDLDLDFGVIQSDYSLLTNTFPIAIPRQDYHVCRMAGGMEVSGGKHIGHSDGNGSHSHTLPAVKPGDRVLVAWVQNEAIVIDAVTKL